MPPEVSAAFVLGGDSLATQHNSTCIPFRCSLDMFETISRIAASEGKNKSEVMRDLVQQGLVAGGYVTGQQELGKLVQDAVTAVLRPQVERLATISAKAAQISAAAFFMQVYTDKLLAEPNMQSEIDAVATKARRLGIEYLWLAKGKDIDAFIADGNRRMTNGSMPE